MAVVVDPLFDTTPFTTGRTPRCFRNTLSCHMMSTLAGEDGRRELVAFAATIGLRPGWIQRAGTELEHFDLTASRRAAAVDRGAREVGRRWRRGDPC